MLNNTPFWKLQGTGNDFVFLFKKDLKAELTKEQIINICQRRTGVGADGLVLLQDKGDADFIWEFYNSDGGMVNMCGNAARCAVALWCEHAGKTEAQFQTNVGLITGRKDQKDNVEISYNLKAKIEKKISGPYSGMFAEGQLINTGVPHCVVLVKDTKSIEPLGEDLRPYIYDQEFGESGANLTFYNIIDEGKIRSISFERGVNDFTLSCGTGAMASSFAYIESQKHSGAVHVAVPGGDLRVRYDDSKVFLAGDAKIVYRGFL